MGKKELTGYQVFNRNTLNLQVKVKFTPAAREIISEELIEIPIDINPHIDVVFNHEATGKAIKRKTKINNPNRLNPSKIERAYHLALALANYGKVISPKLNRTY